MSFFEMVYNDVCFCFASISFVVNTLMCSLLISCHIIGYRWRWIWPENWIVAKVFLALYLTVYTAQFALIVLYATKVFYHPILLVAVSVLCFVLYLSADLTADA